MYLIFSQPQFILPKAMKIESYIMPIPCQGSTFIFHETFHISHQFHNQLIMLNSVNQSHTSTTCISCLNRPKTPNNTKSIPKQQRKQNLRVPSPSLSLRQKSLAQARVSLAQASSLRLGEG